MTNTTIPVATRRRRRRRVPLSGGGPARVVGLALLWFFVALNIAALVWVVLQAFRDTRSILASPFGLPDTFSFENFSTAWNISGFGVATLNSVLVAVISSVLTVAAMSCQKVMDLKRLRRIAAPFHA